jgi:hypothetical protein
LALSSLMAISRGSDSPSSGTNTGAFMLCGRVGGQIQHSQVIRACEHTAAFAHDICSALVPNILARSYFVRYGVVTRFAFGFAALPVRTDGSP